MYTKLGNGEPAAQPQSAAAPPGTTGQPESQPLDMAGVLAEGAAFAAPHLVAAAAQRALAVQQMGPGGCSAATIVVECRCTCASASCITHLHPMRVKGRSSCHPPCVRLCTRVPSKQPQQSTSAAVHVVQMQCQVTLASDLSSPRGRRLQAQPRSAVQLLVGAQPPRMVIVRACHACHVLEQSHCDLCYM